VGSTLYNQSNPSGIEVLTAANGCDSTVNVSLSFFPLVTTELDVQICPGETYFFDGENLSLTGQYQATFNTVNGCDSIVTLSLEVTDAPGSSFTDSFCDGEDYTWNGQTYSAPGTYQQTFEAIGGCDSIVILELQALPLPEITGTPPTSYISCGGEALPAITLSPSNGATLDWYSTPNGGTPLLQGSNTFLPPATGTYYAEARNIVTGCQSPQRLQLTVEQRDNAITQLSATTCLEAEAGVDTSFYSTVQGCDSLVILTTIHENIPLTQVAEMTCDWEAVGTDIQVFTTAEGCDSVVQYQYTFEPALITTLPDAASCDETEWGRDTTFLTTPGGCDSLLIQETLPAPPAETVLDTQICAGESLLFGSQLIESEGAYFDTLFTVAGCDSIITLNVAVASDAPVSITEYLCPGDTILFGGNLIAGPGQFTETFTDQFGCDSTIQLSVESIDADVFSLTPDEQIILEGNTSVTFSLTDNDQLPPDYTLELTQLPLHGTASVSEGELTYDLTNPSFLGVDSFGYRVCTQVCIDTCLEASIRISTLADCLTEIQANLPTGFTPDGDGFNDELDPLREVSDIGCLQNPERATMRVLNRWGEVVFEADPYREWDGRYTNGQIVPQGTYYYILTFELDGENVITQYVHVLRTE
jgi:gliding motility-associated-like protein